jgi:hypothetical protein
MDGAAGLAGCGCLGAIEEAGAVGTAGTGAGLEDFDFTWAISLETGDGAVAAGRAAVLFPAAGFAPAGVARTAGRFAAGSGRLEAACFAAGLVFGRGFGFGLALGAGFAFLGAGFTDFFPAAAAGLFAVFAADLRDGFEPPPPFAARFALFPEAFAFLDATYSSSPEPAAAGRGPPPSARPRTGPTSTSGDDS